jgi:hypothetical protein
MCIQYNKKIDTNRLILIIVDYQKILIMIGYQKNQ